MKIINEIQNIKGIVEVLLRNHKHLQDSDQKLIANIWYSQLQDKNISAIDLLKEFSNGNLVNPESIRRCRQKIQEQNPELRGSSYKTRSKLGVEMINVINDL